MRVEKKVFSHFLSLKFFFPKKLKNIWLSEFYFDLFTQKFLNNSKGIFKGKKCILFQKEYLYKDILN